MAKKKKKLTRPKQILTAVQVYDLALDVANHQLGFTGIDPTTLARIITAIAKKESTFDANAQNPGSSARGLMQILSKTQAAIEKMLKLTPAPDQIWDPAYSLMLGANYLAYQYHRYGDWQKAVHAYNQGSYPGKAKAGAAYRTAVFNQYGTIPFDNLA